MTVRIVISQNINSVESPVEETRQVSASLVLYASCRRDILLKPKETGVQRGRHGGQALDMRWLAAIMRSYITIH
jgi:hypothetical protein